MITALYKRHLKIASEFSVNHSWIGPEKGWDIRWGHLGGDLTCSWLLTAACHSSHSTQLI